MESFGQTSGMILYRTRLIGHKSGSLTITEPHDYALVFLNGQFIDTVFRDGGHWTVKLPKTDVKDPVLEILVENMGHINFAQYLIDRKGITDRVTLNGMTLMNWETFNLPLNAPPAAGSSTATGKSPGNMPATGKSAGATPATAAGEARRGLFFKGSFTLDSTADTYLDLSAFKKGIVWVNGHNLGRYWYVGPQQHLYCPAPWLHKGKNEVVVLDLHQTEAATIRGVTNLY